MVLCNPLVSHSGRSSVDPGRHCNFSLPCFRELSRLRTTESSIVNTKSDQTSKEASNIWYLADPSLFLSRDALRLYFNSKGAILEAQKASTRPDWCCSRKRVRVLLVRPAPWCIILQTDSCVTNLGGVSSAGMKVGILIFVAYAAVAVAARPHANGARRLLNSCDVGTAACALNCVLYAYYS